MQERLETSPRFGTVRVSPSSMGRVIGTGGSNIKEVEAQSGARIHSSEDDAGLLRIYAPSGASPTARAGAGCGELFTHTWLSAPFSMHMLAAGIALQGAQGSAIHTTQLNPHPPTPLARSSAPAAKQFEEAKQRVLEFAGENIQASAGWRDCAVWSSRPALLLSL